VIVAQLQLQPQFPQLLEALAVRLQSDHPEVVAKVIIARTFLRVLNRLPLPADGHPVYPRDSICYRWLHLQRSCPLGEGSLANRFDALASNS
jgi:hypothetical protein